MGQVLPIAAVAKTLMKADELASGPFGQWSKYQIMIQKGWLAAVLFLIIGRGERD